MKNTDQWENSLNDNIQKAAKNAQQDGAPPDELTSVIAQLLQQVADDPEREGLEKTPERTASAFQYFTSGYEKDPENVLNDAMYSIDYDEMVISRDIDFFSLCEHHLLPFYGKAHVAYIPDEYVVGLSKIARLVEMFSRRLQVQERLTKQVASTISDQIQPQGVGVVVEAKHLCMKMRGVEKQNSTVVTSEMVGNFRQDSRTRAEFLNLIGENT